MIRLLLAALLLLIPAAAQAQTFPAVDAYLDEAAAQGFSGTVLVARDGRLLTRAYGLADREWGIRNTLTTRFRIGSLTKQFTAAAILLLVKDGKLGLDDPLCRHLDPCPAAWAPVRIAMLLDHSSGIPDFVRLPGAFERFVLPAKLDQTIATLAALPLDFAPGSDARYGNSGLLIAARLIETKSGMRYAEFIDRRIFAPLGMKRSSYGWDAPLIPERARGYVTRNGTIQNAPYIDMSVPVGAGSQISTIGDLYRWDRALRSETLLPTALLDRMFTPNAQGYGLGWEVATENGRRVIEHNGDINGFGAFIARYPDQDAVIVILTNMEGTKVRAMKDAIASRLFTGR